MPILIDLDPATQATSETDRDKILHNDEHRRVLDKLTQAPTVRIETERTASHPKDLDVFDVRVHDAILVAARRGEGKTTFLTRLLRDIVDHPTPRADGAKLYSLGIIDPTLIESKQNIIMVIIDRIRIATEHHRKNDTTNGAHFDELNKVMRSMAEGLTLLDGIGGDLYDGHGWSEPDYILDKGLDEASAANSFERRLRDYVEAAVKYVGYNAFVLAIDDVDTWFERGWPVLEALRKYLAIPHLRIILSGDPDLFSMLVRRQQWKQMDRGFLDAEGAREKADAGSSRLPKIGGMVDELEDQYLVKVLPPENRITLRSLGHYEENGGVSLCWGGQDNEVRVKAFIGRFAGALCAVRASDDLRQYQRHLLGLPLRSAVRVMQGARNIQARETPEASRVALDAMRHVFWNKLMSLGFDVNEVRDPTPASVINLLSGWLTENGLWRKMARFHPVANDETQDSVAIFLAAVLVSAFRRSPGLQIEYMLKMALVREKVDRGEVSDLPKGRQPGSNDPSSVADLLGHIAPTAFESSVQFVSRLSAWDAVLGRRLSQGIRMSGISVPTARIREVDAAQEELYGLEYVRGTATSIARNQLDRKTLRDVLKPDGDDDRAEKVLKAFPKPLRGYHAALRKAGWSYRARRSQLPGFQGYLAEGVERLADRLSGEAGIVARLPINRISSGQQSESGNYSFLRLLSVVGDLIDLLPSGGEASPGEAKEALIRGVSDVLEKHTLLRSYPTPQPDNTPQPEDTNEDVEDEEESSGIDEEGLKRLAETLANWLIACSDQHGKCVSPLTLSRVWTRLTYTFDSIRSRGTVHLQSRYLGVVFYRTVIAFLHALGVECMRATGRRVSPKASNNPVKSPSVFAALLEDIEEQRTSPEYRDGEDTGFFELVFSCPLWAYFLVREKEDPFAESKSDSEIAAVVRHHRARLSDLGVEDAYPSDVRLSGPSWESSNKQARFESLYYPLNVVPILGLSRQIDRNAAELSRALAGLAASDEKGESDDETPTPTTRRRRRRPIVKEEEPPAGETSED